MKKTVSLVLVLSMMAVAVIGFGAAANEQTLSNTEKALTLINTFATGDADMARSLLAEDYIQHNLAYGTGADAFVGSVEYLASAEVKTTVNNIRAFEDGDKVFLQTVYNFAGAGEQVAFDIFRIDENGKIAEHWDVMETIADEATWQNQSLPSSSPANMNGRHLALPSRPTVARYCTGLAFRNSTTLFMVKSSELSCS